MNDGVVSKLDLGRCLVSDEALAGIEFAGLLDD